MLGAPASEIRALATTRASSALVALLLFVGLVLTYHLNRSVIDEGDAVPSVELPYRLLATGRLSFDPEEAPGMFEWRSKNPLVESEDLFFQNWQIRFGDKTAAEWRAAGALTFKRPRYFLVESTRQHTYVSTFGPIPGILSIPVAAVFRALDHSIVDKLFLKLAVAKLTASLLVAGCAVLVFLSALRFVARREALALGLLYGIGSCAWAISSQTLWQQSVTQLFLALGAFFFLREGGKREHAALAGLAFGAATATRVTGLLVLGSVAVYLLIYERHRLPAFVIGALPAPIAIGAYNFHFFGSPLVFAQELVGHRIALEKTGSAELWQTPIFKGLIGLLVSPSRGLLIFSPLLALGLWGMVRAWRDARYRSLRPLVASAAVMMLLQCKWFDWWGGWAYGYRPWLDVVPFLVLFTLPLVPEVTASPRRIALCGALFVWGVAVQALGAWAYDRTWNERVLFVTKFPNRERATPYLDEESARAAAEDHGGSYLGPTRCNIDFDYCRRRLWSVSDSVLVYALTHLAESRARRLPSGWADLGAP